MEDGSSTPCLLFLLLFSFVEYEIHPPRRHGLLHTSLSEAVLLSLS